MHGIVQISTKHSTNRESAIAGLENQGVLVSQTDDIDGIVLDAQSVIYGNMGFAEKAISRLGYHKRAIAHVPDDLLPYAGRSVEKVPLREALERRHTESIFIKPIPERHKQFNGLTFDNPYDIYQLANYPDDELVLLSPKINIVSEWRGFVFKDELLDAKNYKGDFRVIPNYSKIEPFLNTWNERPIAWSCDFGVTDKGETIIVECNDVMSLGWYNLTPMYVGSMLVARWEEIHRNKST